MYNCQGGANSEYTEEFYELVLRNELNENEEQKEAQCIGGLRLNVQDILNQQGRGNFSDLSTCVGC